MFAGSWGIRPARALWGGEPAGNCTWPLKPADTTQENRLGRILRRRNVNQCGLRLLKTADTTSEGHVRLKWVTRLLSSHCCRQKLQLWAGLQVLVQTDHNQPDSAVVSMLKSLLFLFYPSKDAAGNQTPRCMRRSAGQWWRENMEKFSIKRRMTSFGFHRIMRSCSRWGQKRTAAEKSFRTPLEFDSIKNDCHEKCQCVCL